MGYCYILGCLGFTVYGQLILKWRMTDISLPDSGILEITIFLIKKILFDPFILSGLAAGFVASLFWMAAMTKFPLSFAYPFMSLAFVFVMLGSAILYGEALNFHKVIGVMCIGLGLVVISRGY